jgi:1-acyl-sn-glycerol-3-phosphate acyltransferase
MGESRTVKVSIVRRLWVALSVAVIACYATRVNRCQVVGSDNIPKKGGVLFLANHISALDTVFLPFAILQRRRWQMVWAPAKEELFSNPVLGAIFRSWGAFPVKRGRDLRAGRELARLLANDAVMLFPEGTRHKDGQLGQGNRGVGKLIYTNRPVVVPVSLTGLNAWRVGGWRQWGEIRFGAPLEVTDLLQLPDEKQTHLLIVERAMAQIATGLAAAQRQAGHTAE